MSYRVWLLFIIIFLFSCAGNNQFPPLKSEAVDPEMVNLLESISFNTMDSIRCFVNNQNIQNSIDELDKIQLEYIEKNKSFSLKEFEEKWQLFNSDLDISKLNLINSIKWFNINATLLQITGNAKYAVEMEKIIEYGIPEKGMERTSFLNLISSFIYTKNVDHIHVNLFMPAEISYEHTMHGNVKINQEFNYPEPGKMTINFGMEKRQYIELFIRIPDWAIGATVTVKNVKYFAPPGGYCQIAKKWKEGDIVEIYFPKNKTIADL